MQEEEQMITHTGVVCWPKPKPKPVVIVISVMDYIHEVRSLLEEHWQEVALNKELMVLKPNLTAYDALEREGRLLAYGAFVRIGDTDGYELVGYSVSVLVQHLHYADLLVAQNDVIFVSKAHRNSRAGLDLIRLTERDAKARGAKLMLWHAKQRTALEQLLPRMGYGVFETILSKEL